jgi:hypothetical protein
MHSVNLFGDLCNSHILRKRIAATYVFAVYVQFHSTYLPSVYVTFSSACLKTTAKQVREFFFLQQLSVVLKGRLLKNWSEDEILDLKLSMNKLL